MGICGTYFCASDDEYLEASLNESVAPYPFDEDPDIVRNTYCHRISAEYVMDYNSDQYSEG